MCQSHWPATMFIWTHYAHTAKPLIWDHMRYLSSMPRLGGGVS
jgi:hypothetical protein